MASSRQLKSKLRTVGNIKQLTKAMQMVSAAKMRKSQEVALRARPFAKETLSLLQDIAVHEEAQETKSAYFKEPGQGKACLIAVTSDKGLAGSYNSQVLRIASSWLQDNRDAHIVAVGRKARDYFATRGVVPVKEFLQFSDIVTLEDVKPLSSWVVEAFERGRYQRIQIASTLFFSALSQKPALRQILPLNTQELQEAVENIVPKTGKYADWNSKKEEPEDRSSHLLEPSPGEILEILVRSLVAVEVLHYIFEANAAEHSSRMIAMKSATENASSLQEELRLALNKARQSGITQELTEISTAKEALSSE